MHTQAHFPSTTRPSNWQQGFLAILPAVETHAQVQFRRLPLQEREEAIQEAIANACVNYQLLAARGKLDVARPGMLAMYAVNAVRSGRHVGGSQDSIRDALSPTAQTRHAFRTISYDRFDPATREWKQIAIEGRRTAIPDLAAFRIDFARWLRTLTGRDRRIIRLLVRGERTSAVAQVMGVSDARISQLRRRYEREWAVYQGETGAR